MQCMHACIKDRFDLLTALIEGRKSYICPSRLELVRWQNINRPAFPPCRRICIHDKLCHTSDVHLHVTFCILQAP